MIRWRLQAWGEVANGTDLQQIATRELIYPARPNPPRQPRHGDFRPRSVQGHLCRDAQKHAENLARARDENGVCAERAWEPGSPQGTRRFSLPQSATSVRYTTASTGWPAANSVSILCWRLQPTHRLPGGVIEAHDEVRWPPWVGPPLRQPGPQRNLRDPSYRMVRPFCASRIGWHAGGIGRAAAYR